MGPREARMFAGCEAVVKPMEAQIGEQAVPQVQLFGHLTSHQRIDRLEIEAVVVCFELRYNQ